MGPKERYYNIGWPCVGFIITIIIVNLCVALVTIVGIIRDAWRKARSNKFSKVSW